MSICKKIKRVQILPGCISCGTCEAVCPKVFLVKRTAEVLAGADIKAYEELIREAADLCPVSVIHVENED